MLIVNSDGFAPSDYASVFQAVGLDKLSYSPPSESVLFSAWPTLGSMIDAGTRLVTFMDAGADFTQVPYIIEGVFQLFDSSAAYIDVLARLEFVNVWETAFDVTDTTFDCNVNRTKGDPTTEMYLINHFLDMPINIIASTIAPNKTALNETNAASGVGSLGLQASNCAAQYGRNPNFMLVDVSHLFLAQNQKFSDFFF